MPLRSSDNLRYLADQSVDREECVALETLADVIDDIADAAYWNEDTYTVECCSALVRQIVAETTGEPNLVYHS